MAATIREAGAWPPLARIDLAGQPINVLLSARTGVVTIDEGDIAAVAIAMCSPNGLGLYQPLDRVTAETWIAELRRRLDAADAHNGVAA